MTLLPYSRKKIFRRYIHQTMSHMTRSTEPRSSAGTQSLPKLAKISWPKWMRSSWRMKPELIWNMV